MSLKLMNTMNSTQQSKNLVECDLKTSNYTSMPDRFDTHRQNSDSTQIIENPQKPHIKLPELDVKNKTQDSYFQYKHSSSLPNIRKSRNLTENPSQSQYTFNNSISSQTKEYTRPDNKNKT